MSTGTERTAPAPGKDADGPRRQAAGSPVDGRTTAARALGAPGQGGGHSGDASTAVPGLRPRANLKVRFNRDRSLVFMALPAVILLAVFAYLPMLGNVVAFQDYSPYIGIPDSPWVGMENFTRVLADPDFWLAVKNTLVITAFQLVFFFPIPIALAMLLNSLVNPRLRSAIQAVVYLPHFFSWVLVVSVFQ
jgi:putative aldouronate transport system permease protein